MYVIKLTKLFNFSVYSTQMPYALGLNRYSYG